MEEKAIQDFYPDDAAHCFGCGRLNKHGHQIKTYWNNGETITRFKPENFHTAFPGFVYGGLIASLIDCHGTGTAALIAYKSEGRDYNSFPPIRFVTASLQIDYLKPTPIGVELILHGKIIEQKQRKVISEITVEADGEITARGKLIAVQMPESMIK